MATAAAVKANCRKVICVGRNYADHVKELNNTLPKSPFFFSKPPSSILLPRSGPFLRPCGVCVHHEVELGLIIGKTVRDLDEQDAKGAMGAIEAYLLAIDMTARNLQSDAKHSGLPWTFAKGFDTFLPISAPIRPARLQIPGQSSLDAPHNAAIRLWLSVNGQLRQSGSTAQMLFRIPRLLSEISRVMTLEAGDVVLTGTPAGVGEVRTGDVVEAGLEVNGVQVEEASIRLTVEDKLGLYEYQDQKT